MQITLKIIIIKILSKGRPEYHFSDAKRVFWQLGGLTYEAYTFFQEMKLHWCNNQQSKVEWLSTPIHSNSSYCLCHAPVK